MSFSDYEKSTAPPSSSERNRGTAPARDDGFRILAVLDGTRESGRLLDYLIGLRDALGVMDVVMIHCYQPALWKQIGPLASGQRNIVGEMTKRSRQFASRKLAAAQIKQSHRQVLGDPSDMILKLLAEQQVDMLLLAGHEQQSAPSRALSRVGLAVDALPQRIMRQTDVPVCVIR